MQICYVWRLVDKRFVKCAWECLYSNIENEFETLIIEQSKLHFQKQKIITFSPLCSLIKLMHFIWTKYSNLTFNRLKLKFIIFD